MVVKSIYIARHGYRANWLPLPHPPNPTGIDSDPPLAPHGAEQAKELAAFLTALPENERPQFIISSPFYRCVETCEPIAKSLSLKVVLERGVGEWYKKHRPVIPEPADYGRLSGFFGDVLVKESEWSRDNTIGVIPDLTGETEQDIFDRANKFWSKFFGVFESKFPEVESILIVTHAATKIALGSSLLNLDGVLDYLADGKTILRAGACSLDKYVKGDSSDWEIVMNGNCDFLSKGEEMNWTFHSQFEAGSDEDIKARKEEEERKRAREQELKDKTDSTSATEGLSDEEYEDFYVTIDIPMIGKHQHFDEPNKPDTPRSKINLIKSSAELQITDLNHDNPMVKLSNNSGSSGRSTNGVTTGPGGLDGESINNMNVIDGKIYETSWKRLVGTDLVFDDYGELIGKVEEHLVCNELVRFQAKENPQDDEEEDEEDPKDTTRENVASTTPENGEESELSNDQSAFLKKALKLARKRTTNDK